MLSVHFIIRTIETHLLKNKEISDIIRYEYLDFDSSGNWLRVIKYYFSKDMYTSSIQTETRTIEYYE